MSYAVHMRSKSSGGGNQRKANKNRGNVTNRTRRGQRTCQPETFVSVVGTGMSAPMRMKWDDQPKICRCGTSCDRSSISGTAKETSVNLITHRNELFETLHFIHRTWCPVNSLVGPTPKSALTAMRAMLGSFINSAY